MSGGYREYRVYVYNYDLCSYDQCFVADNEEKAYEYFKYFHRGCDRYIQTVRVEIFKGGGRPWSSKPLLQRYHYSSARGMYRRGCIEKSAREAARRRRLAAGFSD
jgi:hypothetical protein